MAEITAALVKELREETNVGMMECKKALVEAHGDKAAAISTLITGVFKLFIRIVPPVACCSYRCPNPFVRAPDMRRGSRPQG